MTKSRDGVDPPFCKRSVQLTIAAIALLVSLWQLVTLTRLSRREGRNGGDVMMEPLRWGERSGSGHPLIQIDINRAGPRELSLLPGVGPIRARQIMANRQRLGPFESLDALGRVHGIGDKTVAQIQVLGYVGEDQRGGRVTDPSSGDPSSGAEGEGSN
jgi:competence ComEA-like helix-hairpin-helix protein